MFINLYKYSFNYVFFSHFKSHFTINQAIIIIKQCKNAIICPNLPTSQYILRIISFST